MWKTLAIALALLGAACTSSSPDTTTTTEPLASTTTTSATQGSTTTSSTSPSSTSSTSTTTTVATTTTAAPPTTATTTTITAPPGNRAPVVEIISPGHLSAHTAGYNVELADFGAFISLSSIASDEDGDPVTVTWSSSATGGLGKGESIVAWISTQGSDASQPVLTATATDKWGVSSSASVQIIVWIPSDA